MGVLCGAEQSNLATSAEHPTNAKTRCSRAKYPSPPIPRSCSSRIQEGSIPRPPADAEQQPECSRTAHPSLWCRSDQRFDYTEQTHGPAERLRFRGRVICWKSDVWPSVTDGLNDPKCTGATYCESSNWLAERRGLGAGRERTTKV